tara:strand:+ start:35 stop:1216 length:1182 start_codon:yes stop_codon:yes gene_type:complete
MSKLFVFTENYVRGGGNSYLIDLINSVSVKYKELLIFSNKNGLFDTDLARLKCSFILESLFFITSSSLLNKIKSKNTYLLNSLKFLFLLIDPILLLINTMLFISILRKIHPSKVLSCNGGYPASRACLAMVFAAKLLGIPIILSIVSVPAKRRVFMSYYEKIIDRLVWTCVSKVIVNAKYIVIELQKLRDMPSEKAHIVHNALNDIEYSNKFNKLKVSGKFLIGYVSRIEKPKGVFYLLNAFSILLTKHPQLELVFYGAGSELEALTLRVRQLGIENSVNIAGHFYGDVSSILSNFDVYAFPSLWEGLPYSILEAMRSSCAIVSTNVGGIPEAINDEEDAILVEPGSTEALVLALGRLINNQELRTRISASARMKFMKNFTLDKMAFEASKIL